MIARDDAARSAWSRTTPARPGSGGEALRAHAARTAAGLHGAVGVRPARRPAADAQRQARSQGAARARRDAATDRPYEPPQGEIEDKLARIWAELLDVPRVGRHDDFFALGGHSLLAISLLERMRRDHLHTDVTSIFTAATLTELAAATTLLKEIVL